MKCFVVLILSAFLIVAQVAVVFAAETTASPEKVLSFLRDVGRLDLANYNITLTGPTIDHPDDLGGLAEMVGVYTLKSEPTTLEVIFIFIDNNLSSCLLKVRQGSPQFIGPLPANSVEAAEEFLQRYELFSGDPMLNTMSSMLDSVDATRNVTKTSGNLSLAVTIIASSSSFSWKNTYNGAVFSELGVTFQNQSFSSFGDDRSYVKIGSTDVNISREEAISMALNRAKNFSWTYRGEKINNFTIVNDHIKPVLYTKGRDQPLVLYPYWLVTMPLDNLYPGFVTEIEVQIWADTGEIISIYTLGIGGDFPQNSPTPQPSQTTTEPSTSPSPAASPSTSLSPPSSPSPTPQPSILASATPPSTTQPTTSPSPQPSDNKAQPTEEFPFIFVVAAAAGIITAATATTLFIKKKRFRV